MTTRLTKREIAILEHLAMVSSASEADLRTSNKFMCDRFYFVTPRLADGFFWAGEIPNAPQRRRWRITQEGRQALKKTQEISA